MKDKENILPTSTSRAAVPNFYFSSLSNHINRFSSQPLRQTLGTHNASVGSHQNDNGIPCLVTNSQVDYEKAEPIAHLTKGKKSVLNQAEGDCSRNFHSRKRAPFQSPDPFVSPEQSESMQDKCTTANKVFLAESITRSSILYGRGSKHTYSESIVERCKDPVARQLLRKTSSEANHCLWTAENRLDDDSVDRPKFTCPTSYRKNMSPPRMLSSNLADVIAEVESHTLNRPIPSRCHHI